MTKPIIFNLGIFILCFLALSLWGFYWAIRPMRITSTVTPKNFGIPYENVEFKTKDGVLIRGWYIPSKNPTSKSIILLHGYPADKGDILPSRLFLHTKYNLLFIDFRYLGESEGSFTTVGKNEIWDVAAAINFLHQKKQKDIGLWGFSLGGAVALMTAAEYPEDVKAIVAESSYSSLDAMATNYFHLPLLNYPLSWMLRLWGKLILDIDLKKVSPLESAGKVKIPVLLMHSKQDHVIPFSQAELFQQSLKNKSNFTFIFHEDLLHGQPVKNYNEIIENFFDKNM